MDREEIIRDEANSFAFEYLEYKMASYNGHKAFMESVKEELLNFYAPEAKMIYLDQIKKNVDHFKAEHIKGCQEEECEKDKAFN
jgi:hypothetical protein